MYCTQGLKRTQLYKTELFFETMQLQQFGHMNSDQFYSWKAITMNQNLTLPYLTFGVANRSRKLSTF